MTSTKYHVVCHDCTFEGVEDESIWAFWHTHIHRELRGHDVEYGAI